MAKIEFVHVTKRYPGTSSAAVDDVSFAVAEGTLCMFLGTSGSGKTTLLRMINRLIDPTSGQILINGTPTTEQDPIALRRSIGYVIQQIGLFPHLTVAENVRVVPSILGQTKTASAPRVDELLHLVGLEPQEYRDRFPRQLSGGQQQRVGLARALAADPEVLLMDEPFGALDAITRERMQDELHRIQRDVHKTILFVTHDVQEALKLGDQIAVMADSHLVQVGTPTELLMHPANDFVARLVGADNVLHLYENLPVAAITEPATQAAQGHIDANASVLQAMVQLVQSGQAVLAVERAGVVIGQVTLAAISGQIRHAPQVAATETSVGASAE
jgi:osmoprotectant transport system ATP-binding protein